MRSLLLFAFSLTVVGSAALLGQRPPPGGPGGRGGPPFGGDDNQPLPKSKVEITVKDGYRFIVSNGIPDHEPGRFPNRGNPNSIRAQNHRFRMTAEPKEAERPTAFGLGMFGFAVNGVPFDPGAAEFWQRDRRSGWQYEAKGGSLDLGLDSHNAHVQPTGNYHYHGVPTGLVKRLSGGEKKIVLLGYAADGFPIYNNLGHADPKDTKSELKKLKPSWRLKQGTRPGGPGGKYDGSFTQDWEYVAGSGDLDDCNGRFAITEEYPSGIYCYAITEEFPFIPRQFKGKPDESFRRGPPGGPGRPPGGE